MSTEAISPLRQAKDLWNILIHVWGDAEPLAEKRVLPTGEWLAVRDWLRALGQFVRRVILLAALQLKLEPLVPGKARPPGKHARQPPLRKEETSDPATWSVRFKVLSNPYKVSQPSRLPQRRPVAPARALLDFTRFKEPPSCIGSRPVEPTSAELRELQLLRLQRMEQKLTATASPGRARSDARQKVLHAPQFMQTRNLARSMTAIYRTLVNFDAVTERLARRIQGIRERARAGGIWAGFNFILGAWPTDTHGRKVVRPAARRIVGPLREALDAFNSS